MWKITTRIITHHPLTGVGLGGFAGAYGLEQAKYFAEGNASEQEERVAGSPEYGFNEFLQITAENGIIGLILFLLLVCSAFRNAIRNKRIDIVGSLTAFLVFACFSYPFSVEPLCIIFVILLAMASSENAQTISPKASVVGHLWLYYSSAHSCILRSQWITEKAASY